jgi:hypothetical protein
MAARHLKEYVVLSYVEAKTNNTTYKFEPEDIITTKDLPQDMSSTQKYRWLQSQIQYHNIAEFVPGKPYFLKASSLAYYSYHS